MNRLALIASSATLASSIKNPLDKAMPLEPNGQHQLWTSSIQCVVAQSPRLAEFASAVWNVYCEPQLPTHQHLLLLPHQKCDAPFPSLLPLQPLHDRTDFSWSAQLENNWKIPEEELNNYLLAMFKQRKENDYINKQDADIDSTWKSSTTNLCRDTNGFSKLAIQDEEGNPTSIGRSYFPRTLALLRSVMGPSSLAPRPVNINCQAPGSGLAPHSDNMNFLLTCHLALKVPTRGKCIFRIEPNHDYRWKSGRVVIADTSFIHSTKNTSPNESRYVLSFCIWHPDLSSEEREGIVALHSILQQVTLLEN